MNVPRKLYLQLLLIADAAITNQQSNIGYDLESSVWASQNERVCEAMKRGEVTHKDIYAIKEALKKHEIDYVREKR